MRRLVLMRRHFSAIGLTGLVLVAGVVLAACGGGQNGAPATVTVTAADGFAATTSLRRSDHRGR